MRERGEGVKEREEWVRGERGRGRECGEGEGRGGKGEGVREREHRTGRKTTERKGGRKRMTDTNATPDYTCARFAGSRCPEEILVCPPGQPFSVSHSLRRDHPAALCIAPSTPPPPSREELAALTMASISSRVMSPRHMETLSSREGAGL